MNFHTFTDSLRFALRGIAHTYAHEQNFRIQSWVAIIVIVLMFAFGLSKYEMLLLCLMITLVLLLELLNTAVEKMLDLLKPRMSMHVETVKNIMAAMVFVGSWSAGIIGASILLPPIIELTLVWWYNVSV